MHRFGKTWRTISVFGMAGILLGIAAYTLVAQGSARRQSAELKQAMSVANIYTQARYDLARAELHANAFLISHDHQDFLAFKESLDKAVAELGSLPEGGSAADARFLRSLLTRYLPELQRASDYFAALDQGVAYSGPPPDASTSRDVSDAFSAQAELKQNEARSKGQAFTADQDLRTVTTLTVDVIGFALLIGFVLAYRRFSLRDAEALMRQRQAESDAIARSEARFRTLIQNLNDVIIVTDDMARIVYASPSVERVMGYAPRDLAGQNLMQLVHSVDADRAWEGLWLVMHRHGRHETPNLLRFRRQDGSFARLEVNARNLLEHPEIKGIVYNARDVTVEWEANAEQERLISVIEATSDLIVVAGVNGRLLHLNRAAATVLQQWRSGTGRIAATVGDLAPDWLYQRLTDAVDAIQSNGVWRGEMTITTAEGAEVSIEAEMLGHYDRSTRELEYISCVARDVSERKRFQSQLIYMANHDSLTGLHNRRRFEEELEREVTRVHRTQGEAAVVFIDLDGFKAINDSLGHRTGDSLICALAQVIEDAAPSASSVARLGGDEFAVLIPECNTRRAESIAETLRLAVRNYAELVDGRDVNATASIGVALIPAHGTQVDLLLMNADLAMYEAKRDRDAWRLFSPESEYRAELTSRRDWEQRIRYALDNDLLLLAFQPICTVDGAVAAFEVLLRMQGENGEIIPPGQFLPVAERSGLILPIDRWVLSHTLALASKQPGAGLTLSVNVSGRSLADSSFLGFVEQQLTASGADPHNLILEITETAAIADIAEAGRFIAPLARLGVRFAVDDFGAGFASFTYIKHLPVDHVKIDGAFIRNLPRDRDDQAFVRALVDVSHALGKKVVAEFVEDAETMALLGDLDVDFVQGYYLGRPEPFDQALANRHIRRGRPSEDNRRAA